MNMEAGILLVFAIGGLVIVAALYIVYQKLSGMVQQLRLEMRQHADNVIVQLESLLALYAEFRPERGLPRSRGWATSPDVLRVLVDLLQRRDPDTMLECSSGLSTLIAAAHFKRRGRGHVLSLEHSPQYAQKTRELLREHGLTPWAQVLDAPLVHVEVDDWRGLWYDASVLPPSWKADLLFVDGPPADTADRARYPALPVLQSFLSDEAVILLDDANRKDELAIVATWLQRTEGLQVLTVDACEKGCAAFTLAST